MIIVYVDSMEDTSTFSSLYDNIEGSTLLFNPTRKEVVNILTERPNERLMCFGHGTRRGLFSHDLEEMVIDGSMVHLLRDRDIIGIWCYASDFGMIHNLRGFFTNMFISNREECVYNRCGYYPNNDIIFAENRLFAERINKLICNNTPLEDWYEILNESLNSDLEFVNFNYANLSYLDGNVNSDILKLLVEGEQLMQVEPHLWEGEDIAEEERDIDWDMFFGEEDE